MNLETKPSKRGERVYQMILEKLLKATHAYLHVGVSDITCNEFYAEIKHFNVQ